MTNLMYLSIGNSDDKLTQADWAGFATAFQATVSRHAEQVFGVWYSAPNAAWQNMCIACAVPQADEEALRRELTELRVHYRQDSLALAVVEGTEFI